MAAIIIYLIVWAVMGTPAVEPVNAWFMGLLVAILLALHDLGSLRR